MALLRNADFLELLRSYFLAHWSLDNVLELLHLVKPFFLLLFVICFEGATKNRKLFTFIFFQLLVI